MPTGAQETLRFQSSPPPPALGFSSFSHQDPESLLCCPCHSRLQAVTLPIPIPAAPAPLASVPTLSHPHARNGQVSMTFLKAAGCEIVWKLRTKLLQGLTFSHSSHW